MKVTSIKTDVIKKGDDLFQVISKNIKKFPECSVLGISAKIISICQGRLIEEKESKKFNRYELIKKEADYYLDSSKSKHRIMCTIKNNILGINAGINRCNADGGYILLPINIQDVTNNIWKFLKKYYSVRKIGVIVADSNILPLRSGAIGFAISYCGFEALYDYQDEKDIFGRKLSLSQINIADALAVSAVLEMGEAGERRPFCIIEKVTKVRFQNRIPNQRELKEFFFDIKNDPFAPVLEKAKWKKGGGSDGGRNSR